VLRKTITLTTLDVNGAQAKHERPYNPARTTENLFRILYLISAFSISKINFRKILYLWDTNHLTRGYEINDTLPTTVELVLIVAHQATAVSDSRKGRCGKRERRLYNSRKISIPRGDVTALTKCYAIGPDRVVWFLCHAVECAMFTHVQLLYM